MDLFDPKTLRVCSTINHGSEVYGVNWDPAVRDEFLVACHSGNVHLCNMNKSNKPEHVFAGHEKRVFNVVFNNQIPNIFASGSDDQTIRVWNKDTGETIRILKGHTHNVRAIAFNPELPWCLISGSWDATIKLWDCRSGACLFTISEHTADVYGMTFHPQRPFTFVSSSRDTTLRFWSIDQLVSTLRM
jgi:WD40 repeat protein